MRRPIKFINFYPRKSKATRSSSAGSSERQLYLTSKLQIPYSSPLCSFTLTMNVQRLGLRPGRHLRTQALRSTFQRRFASEKTELRGVADNAFNRERAAVKAHAAATSGTLIPSALKFPPQTHPSLTPSSPRSLAKTLTLVTLLPLPNPKITHERLMPQPSVVIPSLILAGINAWNLWDEHWEHWKHLPPLEERVEYPYQNIRTKNFPWGDGDKTLLYVSPLVCGLGGKRG